MWLGKVLNLVIFAIINTQRATTLFIMIPNELIEFNEGKEGDKRYDCREDESAM